MIKKHAVFGIVKLEIHNETTLWVDGRVYSTIEVGDTLYAHVGGESLCDFEVIEIVHYGRKLPQIERGQVIRLVLQGTSDACKRLKPFDELFDTSEVF